MCSPKASHTGEASGYTSSGTQPKNNHNWIPARAEGPGQAKAFQVQLSLGQKPTPRMSSIFGDQGSWTQRTQKLDLEMKKSGSEGECHFKMLVKKRVPTTPSKILPVLWGSPLIPSPPPPAVRLRLTVSSHLSSGAV